MRARTSAPLNSLQPLPVYSSKPPSSHPPPPTPTLPLTQTNVSFHEKKGPVHTGHARVIGPNHHSAICIMHVPRLKLFLRFEKMLECYIIFIAGLVYTCNHCSDHPGQRSLCETMRQGVFYCTHKYVRNFEQTCLWYMWVLTQYGN